MTINTLADGESGAWNSPACLADPESSFLANIICCDIPTTASNPPTCIGDANGSATAQGFGGTSPYDYVWEDDLGNVLQTDNNLAGVSTLSNLAAGTYTVTVTDDLGCVQTTTVTVVDGPPLPVVTASNPGPFCENDPITVSEVGGDATGWLWSSDGSATITNTTDQTPSITLSLIHISEPTRPY